MRGAEFPTKGHLANMANNEHTRIVRRAIRKYIRFQIGFSISLKGRITELGDERKSRKLKKSMEVESSFGGVLEVPLLL